MMTNNPASDGARTLGDLIDSEIDLQDPDEGTAEANEALRDDLRRFDQGLLQVMTMGGVLVALKPALDIPLVDIFKSAWASSLELQAYLDPEKHPPEETSRVRFGKHKISSTHQPKLEVLLNGKRVGTISFDVRLTLHIASTRLQIRDGKIWQAEGPEFKGECQVTYKGFPFIKRQIAKVSLPGTLSFETGMPIQKLPVSIG